ncbi:MAG: acyltransferase [Dermabacter sp.]|nr:acyltransferase [Dermabacter sp.]
MSAAEEPMIGTRFNVARNGMNLVRLILAVSVLFHHSFPLLGLGEGPLILGDHIGGWAVVGFFCLSGYLITASRRSKNFGQYLALRVARIYPAFLVCLVFTAFIFAPLAHLVQTGSLGREFWSTGTTPFGYIWHNIGLKMVVWDVAGGPHDVPYPGAWNGSLWSLYYEFLCYLIVGVVGFLALTRTKAWGWPLVWALTVVFSVSLPVMAPYYGVGFDFEMLAKLLPYFAAGGAVYALRNIIGMNLWIAVGGGLGFVIAAWLLPGVGGQIASPLLVYVLMYVSHVMPSPEWIRTNDVSYGMYIYAFQAQQLVAVLGGAALGYWGFSLASLALTIPLAVASWFVIEGPIIRRTRASTGGTATTRAPAARPQPTQALT